MSFRSSQVRQYPPPPLPQLNYGLSLHLPTPRQSDDGVDGGGSTDPIIFIQLLPSHSLLSTPVTQQDNCCIRDQLSGDQLAESLES